MAELKDVIYYLIKEYPDNLKHELSNARLTKMVYLSDWHSVLNSRQQITEIQWYFDNYGPFVKDVEREASKRRELFYIELGNNMHGQPKKTLAVRDKNYQPSLSDEERTSLDHIIKVTKQLYWDDFIQLVYSTHPVASSERYSYLDLIQKADEYQELKATES